MVRNKYPKLPLAYNLSRGCLTSWNFIPDLIIIYWCCFQFCLDWLSLLNSCLNLNFYVFTTYTMLNLYNRLLLFKIKGGELWAISGHNNKHETTSRYRFDCIWGIHSVEWGKIIEMHYHSISAVCFEERFKTSLQAIIKVHTHVHVLEICMYALVW